MSTTPLTQGDWHLTYIMNKLLAKKHLSTNATGEFRNTFHKLLQFIQYLNFKHILSCLFIISVFVQIIYKIRLNLKAFQWIGWINWREFESDPLWWKCNPNVFLQELGDTNDIICTVAIIMSLLGLISNQENVR